MKMSGETSLPPPAGAKNPGPNSDAASERCDRFAVFETAGNFLCADGVASARCVGAGHGEKEG